MVKKSVLREVDFLLQQDAVRNVSRPIINQQPRLFYYVKFSLKSKSFNLKSRAKRV